jgi:hypothetical protein
MRRLFKAINRKQALSLIFLAPILFLSLWHLFKILLLMPKLMPFTADDVWFEMEAKSFSIFGLLKLNFENALNTGRLTTALNVFLIHLSYLNESIWWRFTFQSLPILILYTTTLYLFYKFKRDAISLISFACLLLFSTFFENSHHQIGAYPLSFPLGLIFCLMYQIENLDEEDGKSNSLTRLFFFSMPLLIYEAFYPIQITALFLKVFPLKLNFSKMNIIIKKILPELICLGCISILYIIFLLNRSHTIYTGTTLSFDLEGFLFAVFNFSTGFVISDASLRIIIFISLFVTIFFKIAKTSCGERKQLLYFFVLWLSPALVLALTSKYQLMGMQGETIYVTTLFSQIGFCGILGCLFYDSQKISINWILIIIGLVLFSNNYFHSENVMQSRLSEFKNFPINVKKMQEKSGSDCVEISEATTLFKHWSVCGGYDDICRKKIAYLLKKNDTYLCNK